MEESLKVQPSVMFEVQKILAVSASPGNTRLYRVQWAPVWVSGLHLVGCEHLIKEFIQQSESKSHDHVPSSIDSDSSLRNINSTDAENVTKSSKDKADMSMLNSDSGLELSTETDTIPEHLSTAVIVKSDISENICQSYVGNKGTDTCLESSWESENQEIRTSILDEIKIKVEDTVVDSPGMDHIYTLNELSLAQDECTASPSKRSDYVRSNTHNTLGNRNYLKKPNQNFPDNTTMELLDNEWCLTDDNRYQCLQCCKIYKEKTHVTRHLKSSHFDIRPYQCVYCSKSFSLKNGLKRHLVLHTGVKPHKCSVCEKTFSLKEGLRMHFRLHTGEKPYQCTICGTGYSDKSNFRRHVQRCEEGKNVIVDSTEILCQGIA